MKQRKLGHNGPRVGEVGLGCMSFSGMYGPSTEEVSHNTLARALELGVTHLDTANVYGMGVSESYIGSFIKKNPNKFVIATKASIRRDKDGNMAPSNDPDYLRTELEASLKRLNTDHVALFYIHRREQSRPVEEVMETLMRFIEEGKIGSIGFSEIAPSTLRRAAAVGPVAAVQSEYSLWTRNADLGLLRACKEVGASFVPFSPLARGMFARARIDLGTLGEKDIRNGNPRFTSPNYEANLKHFDAFRDLSASLNLSPATLAIAWVLHQDPYLIPIPGTRTADHLEELAAASDVVITPEIAAQIDHIMPPGFAHGDRYSTTLINAVERYC
jgi:aryl-alcohol dehydrogenase-like predicted oxidoreductase